MNDEGLVIPIVLSKQGFTPEEEFRAQRETGIFTLEFERDKEYYGSFYGDIGSITCDVLNFPDEVLLKSNEYVLPIMNFLKHTLIQNQSVNLGELEIVVHNAREFAFEFLKYKPFSYISSEDLTGRMNYLFSPEKIAKASGKLFSNTEEARYILNFIGQILITTYSLSAFQKIVRETLSMVDKGKNHSPESYIGYYKEFLEKFNNNKLFDASVGDIGIKYYVKNEKVIKRIHLLNYPFLFKIDFLEGLMIGNIPVRCGVCGRYFLSTNGKATKYCNGLAPGDPKHRSCRQVANSQGTAMREAAEDNPRIYAKKAALERVRHHKRKNHISVEEADKLSRIIESKFIRAATDNEYYNGLYMKELEYENLIKELRGGIAS
ncbi:MAG: DUF6076 domain-containing protein [Clostridia bacterium]|nr:DUF6076 domain-containing protein [Clostridia bacterium]